MVLRLNHPWGLLKPFCNVTLSFVTEYHSKNEWRAHTTKVEAFSLWSELVSSNFFSEYRLNDLLLFPVSWAARFSPVWLIGKPSSFALLLSTCWLCTPAKCRRNSAHRTKDYFQYTAHRNIPIVSAAAFSKYP